MDDRPEDITAAVRRLMFAMRGGKVFKNVLGEASLLLVFDERNS